MQPIQKIMRSLRLLKLGHYLIFGSVLSVLFWSATACCRFCACAIATIEKAGASSRTPNYDGPVAHLRGQKKDSVQSRTEFEDAGAGGLDGRGEG